MSYIITVIGLIAAALTTVSLFPQLLKLWKSKSTKDISLIMYSVFSVGISLWIVYGVLSDDIAIIIGNTLALTQGLIIIALKLKYK